MVNEKDHLRARYPKTNILLVLFILLTTACGKALSGMLLETQIQPTSIQENLTVSIEDKAAQPQSYPIDIRVLLKCLQDLLPDHLAGRSPLVGFAQIAEGEQDPTVFYIGVYNRGSGGCTY